jgi:Fic family protein
VQEKWVWQHPKYPHFKYDIERLTPILLDIKYYQGLLNGVYETINSDEYSYAKLEVLTTEILDTSAIEGEVLNRNSVRSSISKKLGIELNIQDSSDEQSDGLVDILLDATTNYEKPFTKERLFGWHNALFPTGYNSILKINIAEFRGKEDMQIVSGFIGKEKVHYVAPPRESLEKEMQGFFKWLNNDEDLSIIKAAIAHLWFVIIHPMDDGNGRITRALTDMILSKEAKQSYKMYSISQAIKNDKKAYYNQLEQASLYNIDITNWLEWFLQKLLKALKTSKENISTVLEKTIFWDRHKQTVLNERQIKVLNKLLDIGEENFIGGVNTKKYSSMTKISTATASRELKDLVEKKCLVQNEGTAGRNISYKIFIQK